MRESEIESYLVMRVSRDLDGIAYKFTSPNRSGLPDRLVLLPGGEAFFVELKSEKGRLTPNQIREHRRITERGHEVHVCNSKEAVDKLLADFIEDNDPRGMGWVSDRGLP